MSSCIICGTSVDGRICETHEEDVVFEFRGTAPEELSSGRFYRGSVDGYAEFGVFVDIGESVTGLLHRSELDTRLDSLELEPGDTVFVKVQNVRDNGNVDLGWSIRQEESHFRGTLVDDPEADAEFLAADEDDEEDGDDEEEPTETADPKPESEPAPETESESGEDSESTADDGEDDTGESGSARVEPVDVTIDRLDDHVGKPVRLEGEIVTARQTSGPTVFELHDETGTVECAAFQGAGVRAYPDVETGDVVRIEGEVERRRGELQVETEALVVLEDAERAEVTERMEEALFQRARPDSVEPLTTDPAVEETIDDIRDTATAIRRAVIEGRPLVVRHAATADGYVAATAIERATLPLIRQEHGNGDAEYHYFDRRPLEGSAYDMADATTDVTTMLSNRERHGEPLPLFVFVAAGGSAESRDGFDLLDVYDVRRTVIDHGEVDPELADVVDVLVGPAADGERTTATALGANVAAHVNSDVRSDLEHLPAISFWEDTPESYRDLATEAGYEVDDLRQLREAVALEAYYQSYEDKRELISDLLFADGAEDPAGLAGHISEQFRTRMDAEIETAEANLQRHETEHGTVLVLDTEAYTHRYEFPPKPLLLDELHRRHSEECVALLGLGTDTCYVRTDADIDLRHLVEAASETAPEAALDDRGARDGRIEFLQGERDTTREAVLEALVSELSSAATA